MMLNWLISGIVFVLVAGRVSVENVLRLYRLYAVECNNFHALKTNFIKEIYIIYSKTKQITKTNKYNMLKCQFIWNKTFQSRKQKVLKPLPALCIL